MNTTSSALPLVQVIGMMVGVYAYGYYLLAREPKRYCGFIWIALACKTFGPLGFVYSALTGALPWCFGWICVFNDVILVASLLAIRAQARTSARRYTRLVIPPARNDR